MALGCPGIRRCINFAQGLLSGEICVSTVAHRAKLACVIGRVRAEGWRTFVGLRQVDGRGLLLHTGSCAFLIGYTHVYQDGMALGDDF